MRLTTENSCYVLDTAPNPSTENQRECILCCCYA